MQARSQHSDWKPYAAYPYSKEKYLKDKAVAEAAARLLYESILIMEGRKIAKRKRKPEPDMVEYILKVKYSQKR